MANTLNLGTDGNWATKEDSLLAYNSENGNFKPLPFDFTRASSATVVNKAGLIETVGSGEPRIDFSNDAKGALLLEPTRSNLVTYSEDLSVLSKVSVGNASAPITTSNYGISPDGTMTATRVVFDLNGGTTNQDRSILRQSISSGDYYFSIYVKSTNGVEQKVMWHDGSEFNTTTVTSEWVRITYDSRDAVSWGGIALNGTSGVDSSDILVWGFQIEQGSYATSYIPNYGNSAGATRSADACNNGGNEQVFNDSEGTVFINFAADFNIFGSGLADRGISINNGTNTNSARIFQATSLNNRMAYDLDTLSGTNQVFNTSTTFADITDFNKVAFTYKQNEFKIFLNGVQQGSTDTNGSVFSNGTLNGISFDYGQEGNKPFFGRVKEVKYFNTVLTDAELQALTK